MIHRYNSYINFSTSCYLCSCSVPDPVTRNMPCTVNYITFGIFIDIKFIMNSSRSWENMNTFVTISS